MSTEVMTARYDALIEDIAEIYFSTRKVLAEAYWKIGERIVRVDQDGEIRAAYGKHLLERISQDLLEKHKLGFSPVNLSRMRQFYLTHPKSSAPKELTWSHYVELLGVTDDKTRRKLEKLAAREGLSTRELRRLAKDENGPGGVLSNLPLNRPIDLTLYTCARAYPIGMLVPAGHVPLDLGFCVQLAVPESALDSVKVASRPSYTYVATVDRIVDGDTLLVEIELGFGLCVTERLRLRGVDAPELKTTPGISAKDFVTARLRRGARIVIRSHKTDIYGRFVADVFYFGGAGVEGSVELPSPELIIAEGIFLNQELVDSGMAVRIK